MTPHPTEAEIERAEKLFGRMVEAASASNHAGEMAIMKAWRPYHAYDAMVAALQASEREYQDLEDTAPLDSGCIECTVGTVPNSLNTGLCAHHLRVAALSKAGA